MFSDIKPSGIIFVISSIVLILVIVIITDVCLLIWMESSAKCLAIVAIKHVCRVGIRRIRSLANTACVCAATVCRVRCGRRREARAVGTSPRARRFWQIWDIVGLANENGRSGTFGIRTEDRALSRNRGHWGNHERVIREHGGGGEGLVGGGEGVGDELGGGTLRL
jgi:hypothetical protein